MTFDQMIARVYHRHRKTVGWPMAVFKTCQDFRDVGCEVWTVYRALGWPPKPGWRWPQ